MANSNSKGSNNKVNIAIIIKKGRKELYEIHKHKEEFKERMRQRKERVPGWDRPDWSPYK